MEKSKANQKLRSEYLAMNLHDRDLKKQAYNAGVQQGAEQTKLETARNMLTDSIKAETISKYTGLPIGIVEELAKEIK